MEKDKEPYVSDPQIQHRKCVEFLPCKFTQEEIIDMSQEQARTYQDLIELEGRKKEIMADITADIKRKETAMGALSRKINSGYEHRNVDCEWVLNYREQVKTLVRLDMDYNDPQMIVRTAPLSNADLQASLELTEKGTEAAEDPDAAAYRAYCESKHEDQEEPLTFEEWKKERDDAEHIQD